MIRGRDHPVPSVVMARSGSPRWVCRPRPRRGAYLRAFLGGIMPPSGGVNLPGEGPT